MKRVRAGYFGEMTKTLNLEDLIIEFSAEMSCSIARRLYDTAVDGAVEHGAQEGDWILIRNLATSKK